MIFRQRQTEKRNGPGATFRVAVPNQRAGFFSIWREERIEKQSGVGKNPDFNLEYVETN